MEPVKGEKDWGWVRGGVEEERGLGWGGVVKDLVAEAVGTEEGE
jgi:hypothetical protein